jgi:hypothetical protein
VRKGSEKKRSPLCKGDEVFHIFYQMFRNVEAEETTFLSRDGLVLMNINMNIIINIAELRNIGEYLYKVRCKQHNKISNI